MFLQTIHDSGKSISGWLVGGGVSLAVLTGHYEPKAEHVQYIAAFVVCGTGLLDAIQYSIRKHLEKKRRGVQ